MSEVKKIQVDGVSYDLGGGSGLSDDAKNALLDCLSHVAWIDEDGQQYVDALSAALFDNLWNVTNTLLNCVTSNPSGTVAKDGIYSATISAAAGYTLEGATVSITMNGANITSSVYNNGTISIPTVTGDVVITVVAVALTVVSISAVYTQSGTVYDTDSLDDLKADLVVTATYDDSSTAVLPSTDYTLSGTLTAGTSTITVEYDGLTTSFVVEVVWEHQIKVYNGKGVSGTSIVDNANRALSEMINVVGVSSLYTQNTQIESFVYAYKFADSSTTVTSSAPTLVPGSYVGTTRAAGSSYDAFTKTAEPLYACTMDGVWKYLTPNSGYVRLLFKKDSAGTSPIPEIGGTIYLNGVLYHLIEKPASEFE